MKKIAIASLIALAATASSALEVGITTARAYTGTNNSNGGITISEKYGNVGVEVSFERYVREVGDQNRLGITGSYGLFTAGPAVVEGKLGAAYLENQREANGYALTVGVGAKLPITKTVAATLDLRHQVGQSRVQMFDGNAVIAGVKVSF